MAYLPKLVPRRMACQQPPLQCKPARHQPLSSEQLANQETTTELEPAIVQFVVLTAAKIAVIGTQNPPQDQLLRGKLLNAMLLLADLRERVEKNEGKKEAR